MLNALLIASVAATMQPSAANEEIVVTGQRRMDQVQAEKAVNAITAARESQIGRFHEPVCPVAIGLSPEAREVVESRIRAIAQQVGAPLAPVKCNGNLILILSDDSKAIFADIRRNRPEWLNGLTRGEVESIAAQTGPVRAWSATSLRNEDGRAVGLSSDGDDLSMVQVRSVSIAKQSMRQQLDGSVIIIDRAAIEGRTLGELADYAAMRGLAITRSPGKSVSGTILGMFDNPVASREMSSFDRNYLKALYAGDGRELAVHERSRIAKALARVND